MEKISLKTSSNYRTSRDIETALAWNTLRKSLEKMGKWDLFEYIKSVKITEKYITLCTEKPIINAELRLILSELQEGIRESPLLYRELRVKLVGV